MIAKVFLNKNIDYHNMKNNQDSVLKQFNLPSYIKGKTFAEASEAINKRFKPQACKEPELM
mgnify:CR=1 FL=1